MQFVQGNIENSLVPGSVEAEGIERAEAKNNIFVGMGYSKAAADPTGHYFRPNVRPGWIRLNSG
jgi:hypothetical protein